MKETRKGSAAIMVIAVVVVLILGVLSAIFVTMNQDDGSEDALRMMGDTMNQAADQMQQISNLLIQQQGLASGTPPAAPDASGTEQIAGETTDQSGKEPGSDSEVTEETGDDSGIATPPEEVSETGETEEEAGTEVVEETENEVDEGAESPTDETEQTPASTGAVPGQN